jgi:hypothetical protein
LYEFDTKEDINGTLKGKLKDQGWGDNKLKFIVRVQNENGIKEEHNREYKRNDQSCKNEYDLFNISIKANNGYKISLFAVVGGGRGHIFYLDDLFLYDHNKINSEGYNSEGFNIEGYNSNGFDRKGYNIEGYNSEGYNIEGYNSEGYNSEGYNSEG